MVGHQHVGVQLALVGDKCFAQPVEVTLVVLLTEEAGLAVVVALHNVQRDSAEMDAGTSRHGEMLLRFCGKS